MRLAILAAAAALSLAYWAPAQATPMTSIGPSMLAERPLELAGHYYGHPVRCWWKKVRRYDYYGNLVIRRIKVCG